MYYITVEIMNLQMSRLRYASLVRLARFQAACKDGHLWKDSVKMAFALWLLITCLDKDDFKISEVQINSQYRYCVTTCQNASSVANTSCLL